MSESDRPRHLVERPRGFVVDVHNLSEAIEFARLMAQTSMVPEGDRNQPGNILAKMQIGAEIGLPPMQAVNTLYVHKGKVGMEVKAQLALVLASGLLEWKTVKFEGPGPQDGPCTVTVKRVGSEPYSITFGPDEAKKAGLLGGTKDTYTKWDWRMFYNRAMGFALQDEFQDVLRGTVSLDYLRDTGVNVQVDIDGGIRAEIDGREVQAQLQSPSSTELEQSVRQKMRELGFRPAQALTKLTAYRGRLDVLAGELDAEIAKQVPTPKAEPKPTEVKVAEVRPAETTAPPAPVVTVAVKADDGPKCPKCGAENFSNTDCDTCLDMQIAGAEA